MAEFRRPSRLAIVLVALVLPAVMGWVLQRTVANGRVSRPATGLRIELPAQTPDVQTPRPAALHGDDSLACAQRPG
ncbi:MAG: hypothetical protein KC502_17630 [Myxococcales bacterium]|nr:hypothetical protein [Myxococcales bacterium]